MANLGVPVKLLHESLGHIVTVELKSGEMYRGKLMEGECGSRRGRAAMGRCCLPFALPAPFCVLLLCKVLTP
jgi:hypothetical protein